MNIKPLGDRVLVEAIDEKEQIKDGIVIPDSAKEKPQEAKVIAVGTGKLLDNGSVKRLEVKTGQHILYSKYSGTEATVDGEEYLILREEDVLAIVG